MLSFLLVCYFGYHLVQGERGVIAQSRLEAELDAAHAVLARAEEAVAEQERLVNGLRPASLDLDLLTERARVLLNLGTADEFVLFEPRTTDVQPLTARASERR